MIINIFFIKEKRRKEGKEPGYFIKEDIYFLLTKAINPLKMGCFVVVLLLD